jgi:hypothetical protein
MSNRRRTPAEKTRPVTKVKDPADVITVIPYLLGFDPVESLVVVALEGSPQRFGPCARLDLVSDDDPPDAAEHQIAFVAELIAHHGFDPVILLAYSARPAGWDGHDDSTDRLVRSLIDRLRADGVRVAESVRADGERWWSYTCDDVLCCPSEGTPYDAGSSRVAAEAVMAGLGRAPSRDALRTQFEHDPARLAAFDAALVVLLTHPETFTSFTLDDVRRRVADLSGAGDPLPAAELVRLVMSVQNAVFHRAAWTAITRDNAVDQLAFWTSAMQGTPDELLPPVGSLAAFSAWLAGRGVLASHCAERVLLVDADDDLASLVLELCETSTNPASWRGVRAVDATPGQTQEWTGSGVEG